MRARTAGRRFTPAGFVWRSLISMKRPPGKYPAASGLKIACFRKCPSAPVIGDLHWRAKGANQNCCSIKGTKKLCRREHPFHIAPISRICRLGWSGKCDSDQARAQQDKTCNGHSEETVRGEFFTHGTPPIARECWLPSRPIARPARRGRLSRCTVKEISAGSENLNPTDALEQQ